MRLRTCFATCLIGTLLAVSFAAGQTASVKRTKRSGREVQAADKSVGVKASDWPMYGRDLAGSHYNPSEKLLTPATVGRLKPKWVFETKDDVSSQPAVVDGIVYFGSWDKKQYALDAKTGKKVWEFNVGSPSRTGAAYGKGVIFFADVEGNLYALRANTGELKWKVRIDPHKYTTGTSSPIYHNGRVYIGVTSHEELFPYINPKHECCTFRGGVAAFDAETGRQVWRFYTIPEPATVRGKNKSGATTWGPSGGAVWSTVAIHPDKNRLYLTSGNQYTGPVSRLTDAIIAVELDTGKLVWSHQATPKDIWTHDCANDPDCEDLDFDFGTVPITFKGPGGRQLIGAGQKSGWFYALNPRDGKLVWKLEVGPSGKLGGIEFGDATDGERVYVAISNALKPAPQGWVSALDGATGKVLWKTLAPDGGSNFGPITVTGKGNNRLVFVGSTKGLICAYDARNGKVLWQFDTGGAVGGGATVVDGMLYVGSGYRFLTVGKSNNKLYAFSLDGK
jgi:polyvinyl alcohol dehydrogenase (cytochrome)